MLLKKSAVFIMLVMVFAITSKTQRMNRIATGVWGGQHISMKVGAKSATIEYDCARGTIEGPLAVDTDGRFNLRGTHTMERGGPIRADETPKGHPATYTGSVTGNTMTLTLKIGDGEDETFTLEKGKTGELFKCK